ncbi:hypothetical protein [Mycobacterium sp. C31M]
MGKLRVAVALSSLAICTACSSTDGQPIAAEPTGSSATAQPTSRPATPSEQPTPTGPQIGTATMQVRGGTGPVTLTYRINGEPEVTETNVTLPWEKQYPVYDKIETSVTADGGDTELICAIMMDGNLVSFKTEPRPTCGFAHYG